MFAPDQQKAANEAARATRKDGRNIISADGKVRWGREYIITLATRA
jgi:hypothetical protein